MTPKKARSCITHHYACDCREAMAAKLVEAATEAKYLLEELEKITGRKPGDTVCLTHLNEALAPFEEEKRK